MPWLSAHQKHTFPYFPQNTHTLYIMKNILRVIWSMPAPTIYSLNWTKEELQKTEPSGGPIQHYHVLEIRFKIVKACVNRLRQALIDVAFKAAPPPPPPTLLGKKPKCLPVSQPNILLIPKTGMIFQASQQKQQIIMTTIKTISIVPSLLFHKDLSTEVKIAKYREATHTLHNTVAPIPQRP